MTDMISSAAAFLTVTPGDDSAAEQKQQRRRRLRHNAFTKPIVTGCRGKTTHKDTSARIVIFPCTYSPQITGLDNWLQIINLSRGQANCCSKEEIGHPGCNISEPVRHKNRSGRTQTDSVNRVGSQVYKYRCSLIVSRIAIKKPQLHEAYRRKRWCE